jgi:hypothetical protein
MPAANRCSSTTPASVSPSPPAPDLTATTVVACANACCDQENIIGTAQDWDSTRFGTAQVGVAALRVALRPDQPLAYIYRHAALAHQGSCFAMMMHRKQDRRDYMRVEFRRFLTGIILIPTMVIRWARGITVRLTATGPSLDRLPAPGTPPNAPASGDRADELPRTDRRGSRCGDRACPEPKPGANRPVRAAPATSPGVTRHLRDNPISAATAMQHHHLGCSRATMIGSPIWRTRLRRAADARRQPPSPSAQSAACAGASRGSPCP